MSGGDGLEDMMTGLDEPVNQYPSKYNVRFQNYQVSGKEEAMRRREEKAARKREKLKERSKVLMQDLSMNEKVELEKAKAVLRKKLNLKKVEVPVEVKTTFAGLEKALSNSDPMDFLFHLNAVGLGPLDTMSRQSRCCICKGAIWGEEFKADCSKCGKVFHKIHLKTDLNSPKFCDESICMSHFCFECGKLGFVKPSVRSCTSCCTGWCKDHIPKLEEGETEREDGRMFCRICQGLAS